MPLTRFSPCLPSSPPPSSHCFAFDLPPIFRFLSSFPLPLRSSPPQLLRLVAEALNPIGPRGMVYLAAAVSDFFVPWPSMVEHKIQSGAGPLDIHLARVPKMIPLLRSLWCPAALLVSFKVRLSTPLLPLPSLPLSCHTLFET
ncbi:unnamed protein product, partial [Closterium sp. NIES-53]